MNQLEKVIDLYFREKKISNIAIRVGKKTEVLAEYYKSNTAQLNQDTLFDIASVSKIVSATQLALIAIDKGLLSLDDSVSKFFPTEKQITIKNLLTHTMGIGHKNLCKENINYENIGEYILSIPSDIPVGSDVLYSCPGLILLGKILEKVFGKSLDLLFNEYVAKPLDFKRTTYKPTDKTNMVNANKTEEETGIVNDYNCKFLGGVAGNAGLFSNICDLEKFCKMLLRRGTPLYSEETFLKSVQNYTDGMSEHRALGYIYIDETYERTGNLMPTGSIGHGGWTGQIIAADYKTGLYAIILTDIAKCLDENYGDIKRSVVNETLSNICNAIKEDLNI